MLVELVSTTINPSPHPSCLPTALSRPRSSACIKSPLFFFLPVLEALAKGSSLLLFLPPCVFLSPFCHIPSNIQCFTAEARPPPWETALRHFSRTNWVYWNKNNSSKTEPATKRVVCCGTRTSVTTESPLVTQITGEVLPPSPSPCLHPFFLPLSLRRRADLTSPHHLGDFIREPVYLGALLL